MRTAIDRNVPTLRWAYLAVVVLGGIGAHLVSEFAAMGSGAEAVAISPRHIYLGLAAITSLFVAYRELTAMVRGASSGRDAKRIAEMGLATLPFAGRRHFWLVTAALQFAVGSVTEIGEGCPLCGHDVIAGIAGAVLGAVLLALFARALSKRLPTVAQALATYAPRTESTEAPRVAVHEAAPLVVDEFLSYAQLFDRPPPVLQP